MEINKQDKVDMENGYCPKCGDYSWITKVDAENNEGDEFCDNGGCEFIITKWQKEENEKLKEEIRERNETIESIPYCRCFAWARCGTVEQILKGGHHPKCESYHSGTSSTVGDK